MKEEQLVPQPAKTRGKLTKLKKAVAVAGDVLGAYVQACKEGKEGMELRLASYLRNVPGYGFFGALFKEVERLIEDGRVPPGRKKAPEVATACAEVVDDVIAEVPDARRFEMLRRAFLSTLIGDPADPEGTMAILFTRRVRKLSGEEAVVLGCAYRHLGSFRDQPDHQLRQRWYEIARAHSGIPFLSELAAISKALCDKGLFTATDASPPHVTGNRGPLSEFGIALCAFLERAEPLPAPTAAAEPTKP